jgi:hypothetical protein
MWRNLTFAAALAFAAPVVPAVAASDQEPQAPSVGATPSAQADATRADAPTTDRSSPWLLVPLVASSPKLGTSVGAFGAFVHAFDPSSRVSLFGMTYQYTSTHSNIAVGFARASMGADHHRVVALAVFGLIKNDYQDYLGTGQPLKTNDDLKAAAGRYLYRVKGDWFLGAQSTATNYQVFGDAPQDDLVLETLGVKGFESVSLGAVVMHDSRDNEDMPTRGWFLNVNNLAYREALGGAASFDAYRADLRVIWPQGHGHVMAFRQNNWLTQDAPSVAQATVVLRGYKMGQYLAPYMSSIEVEERPSFGARWGATLFAGVAGLYGDRGQSAGSRQFYPTWGAGLHFVIKPVERMLMNLEYAQGVEDNRGVYLKFGYGW